MADRAWKTMTVLSLVVSGASLYCATRSLNANAVNADTVSHIQESTAEISQVNQDFEQLVNTTNNALAMMSSQLVQIRDAVTPKPAGKGK
jgi:hypothetical protein